MADAASEALLADVDVKTDLADAPDADALDEIGEDKDDPNFRASLPSSSESAMERWERDVLVSKPLEDPMSDRDGVLPRRAGHRQCTCETRAAWRNMMPSMDRRAPDSRIRARRGRALANLAADIQRALSAR